MKILVKTAGMTREDWLRWRTHGIGGSDASVIAGKNKYRSIYQLWLEKTGQVQLQEFENDYTYFGNVLEPIVKQEFMRRTGLKVRAKKAMLQSEDYPFMLADLDGVVYENGEMCIFEAKTASIYKQEIWEQGVPVEYIYQVQHYMAVTGARKAYIAALVGGNHFYHHCVYRDEKLIAELIRMEQKFWMENVLKGIEPVIDGSEATTEFLNVTYETVSGGTIMLPEDAILLCERYDELSKEMDNVKEQREAISNQLKHLLKENETGIIGNRKVTWKAVTTTMFDKKRLEKENREIYDSYTVKSQYRRFNVA